MNKYELIGIILGDGYIRYNTKESIYGLEITGDALDDHEYFQSIAEIIEKISKKKPKIWTKKEKKGQSLKLLIYDKKFIEFLIDDLDIVYKNKTFTAEIPQKYSEWKYSKHILRGLFESDGSLYFSRSKKLEYPSYPRIEITTSSKKLAEQIISIMKQKAFKIQSRTRKEDKTIRLYLSGPEMLEKWIQEIGISSMKKHSKYLLWKKLGYYIPYIPYKKRMQKLRERGTAATAVDIDSPNRKPNLQPLRKKATFPGFESQRSLFSSIKKL